MPEQNKEVPATHMLTMPVAEENRTREDNDKGIPYIQIHNRKSRVTSMESQDLPTDCFQRIEMSTRAASEWGTCGQQVEFSSHS